MVESNKEKNGHIQNAPCLIIAIILGVLVIFSLNLLSNRNIAVSLEERIESQLTANKSEYDKMWKKFVEMTQVTELQANQFKKVYDDMIQGRYNKPNLLFQAVKENNPQLDSTVYSRLQTEISGGRESFHNSQKQISDIVREYNTFVRKHFIMSFLTNRKVKDFTQYIVTSDKTSNAFSTKKDDVINLSGGKNK